MNFAQRGINFVLRYEKTQGRDAFDVSRDRSQFGHDVASRDPNSDEERTIEVKATKSTRGGVPDAFQTEFSIEVGNVEFVADYLYVVRYNEDDSLHSLDVVPKDQIDQHRSDHKVVKHVKFASAFMRRLREGEFRERIDSDGG